MAGDWFPLQFWRSRCPEIVRAASSTGRTRHELLGFICDFWSWVSTESDNGKVPGVYVANLPEIIGADARTWEAFAAVGWVAEDAAGIVVPGWETWLSESAKKRAKDARRKKLERSETAPKPRPKSVRETSAMCPNSVRDVSAKCPPTGQDRTGQESTPTELSGGKPRTLFADPKPEPPKPKPESKPPKEPDSPVHRAIAVFCDAWAGKYGAKYPFVRGKDAASVKAMLGFVENDVGEFAEVVGRYLDDADPFVTDKRHPLGVLQSQMAKWLVAKVAPGQSAREKAEYAAKMEAQRRFLEEQQRGVY